MGTKFVLLFSQTEHSNGQGLFTTNCILRGDFDEKN
jgi:hypothetical protein